MGRGGRREPDRKPRPPAGPGRFAQRSDLSEVTPTGSEAQGAYVPTGLPYGDAQRLADAQAVAPIPSLRRSIPPGMQAVPAASVSPEELTLDEILSRPTERPGEPVTTGLPYGPGPGPEVFAEPQPGEADELRATIMAMSDLSMPPQVRALGMLLRFTEDARQARIQRMLAQPPTPQTLDDFIAFAEGDEESDDFPALGAGTLGADVSQNIPPPAPVEDLSMPSAPTIGGGQPEVTTAPDQEEPDAAP